MHAGQLNKRKGQGGGGVTINLSVRNILSFDFFFQWYQMLCTKRMRVCYDHLFLFGYCIIMTFDEP